MYNNCTINKVMCVIGFVSQWSHERTESLRRTQGPEQKTNRFVSMKVLN